MDKEYYSYKKKFMSRWTNIFYLGEMFISGLREKVVDFTNAKNGSMMSLLYLLVYMICLWV